MSYSSNNHAGVGLKHLTGDIKRMLQRIMSIDQNNYPEMLGHTCIINAPGVFKMVWSAIKGFIDPKTLEKIEARTCQCCCLRSALSELDAQQHCVLDRLDVSIVRSAQAM